MTSTVIDRRKNGKGKSSENRRKFLRRIRAAIKKAVPNIANGRKIKDMDSAGGIVNIPKRSVKEPWFHHGDGGVRDDIRPGNKDYNDGDRFKKPPKDSGKSKEGSNGEGKGEDDFIVEITREEFLDYFFEDLELPDLIKTDLKKIIDVKHKNAGWTNSGSPAKLSVIKSMKTAHGRRISLKSPWKKKLKAAEEELAVLTAAHDFENNTLTSVGSTRIVELLKLIEGYKRKLDNIPFIDPLDLRYHSTITQNIESSSAVQIMIMDNSGSMGQREKTLARKFFSLLYMFLSRKYEKVELVFVYHTTTAKEVDEEEFFNSRENGGTVISSALDLVNEIIQTRYTDQNVYICQCSDGDNFRQDNGTCYELLVDDIMPMTQYYAYIQIEDEDDDPEDSSPSDIWASYESVAEDFPNFQMKQVAVEADIYPVFRELFEKKRGSR